MLRIKGMHKFKIRQSKNFNAGEKENFEQKGDLEWNIYYLTIHLSQHEFP